MKKNPPNAKNPRWITPVELSGVTPEHYDEQIESASGSASTATPGMTKRKKHPVSSSAGQKLD